LRVAVTRPKGAAGDTARLVREMGWEAFIVPSIEIVPRPIDRSIQLDEFDWLVVTSASGAEVLWRHFKVGLQDINIAVVGPKTQAAFVKKGILPKLVAKEHLGEGLARELRDHVKGKRVLVARASLGQKELVEMLGEVADVKEIHIYDTLLPRDKSELQRFKELLDEGEIEALVFTSSQATKNLLDFLGEGAREKLQKTIICAIGPVTARTVESYGIKHACVPEQYTLEAALDEIKKAMIKSR
jgi:uroporphyrinogen III methyltransferase/synthase